MADNIWNLNDIEIMIDGGHVAKSVPEKDNTLTVSQLLAIRNAQLLKSINNKLTFFMILTIIGICLAILFTCIG